MPPGRDKWTSPRGDVGALQNRYALKHTTANRGSKPKPAEISDGS